MKTKVEEKPAVKEPVYKDKDQRIVELEGRLGKLMDENDELHRLVLKVGKERDEYRGRLEAAGGYGGR